MEIDYKKAFHETITSNKQITELNKHFSQHMQLFEKFQISPINKIFPESKKTRKENQKSFL